MEHWIRGIVQSKDLSNHFVIERAHRALMPPPSAGVPPRAIIARILNYKDRNIILKAARDRNALQYENCTITIYQDYTHKVQEKRKTFVEVKKKLP